MNALTKLLATCLCLSSLAYPLDKADTSIGAKPCAITTLPIIFEKNVGQMASSYQYLARYGDVGASFALDKVALGLFGGPSGPTQVALRFIGESSAATIESRIKVQSVSNYLVGNDASRWIVGVPNYSELVYRHIYPGIDLVFHGSGNRLEHDFRIAPYADLRQIRFALDSGSRLIVDSEGSIQVQVQHGTLI